MGSHEEIKSDMENFSFTEHETYIVGIGGGSASGKSMIARELSSLLEGEESVIIELDSYYKDFSHIPHEERGNINFDHPDSLDISLLIEHIITLKKGGAIQKPVYDYISHSRKYHFETVHPSRYVIIEGLFTLSIPALVDLFDLKIYVHASDDIRIIRRIIRDRKERGRETDSIIEQYLTSVRITHKTIIEPSRYVSNIIVDWDEYNQKYLQDIIEEIVGGKSRKK